MFRMRRTAGAPRRPGRHLALPPLARDRLSIGALIEWENQSGDAEPLVDRSAVDLEDENRTCVIQLELQNRRAWERRNQHNYPEGRPVVGRHDGERTNPIFECYRFHRAAQVDEPLV